MLVLAGDLTGLREAEGGRGRPGFCREVNLVASAVLAAGESPGTILTYANLEFASGYSHPCSLSHTFLPAPLLR